MKMYCVIQYSDDARGCTAELYEHHRLVTLLNGKDPPTVVSAIDDVGNLLAHTPVGIKRQAGPPIVIFSLGDAITPLVTQRQVTTIVIERQLP